MTESTIERTLFSLEVCIPGDTAWKPDFSLQNIDFLTVNERQGQKETGTVEHGVGGQREGEGKGREKEGMGGEGRGRDGRGEKVFIIFRIRMETGNSNQLKYD